MTAFDKAVEAAQQTTTERGKNLGDVQILLQAAGVSPDQVAFITSNPSLVDQIVRHPELAQNYARLYPAGAQYDYATIAEEYGFGTTEQTFAGSGGADALAVNLDRVTSAAGKIRYADGVLVDPLTGQVTFPDSKTVAGSGLWLAEVYNWSAAQIDHWRKELTSKGYLERGKGGVTPEFVEALRAYHSNRYLYGGGQPVALEDTNTKVTERDFEGLLDPVLLSGEAKQWLTEAYGDEGTEAEQKFWAQRVSQKALQLARKKGYSPANAAGIAASRVQQEFLDTPSAKAAIDNDFENTTLRDELQAAAQSTEFLAFGR